MVGVCLDIPGGFQQSCLSGQDKLVDGAIDKSCLHHSSVLCKGKGKMNLALLPSHLLFHPSQVQISIPRLSETLGTTSQSLSENTLCREVSNWSWIPFLIPSKQVLCVNPFHCRARDLLFLRQQPLTCFPSPNPLKVDAPSKTFLVQFVLQK